MHPSPRATPLFTPHRRRVTALGVAVTLFAMGSAMAASRATATDGCPAVVAHRGGSDVAPEETPASLVSAARAGVDAVEWDLSWTRSGVPVLMHDDTVDRTTDGTGRVSSYWLSDLKKLDAGSWFAPAYAGVRVSTFAEALRTVAPTPGVTALPELKGFVPDTRLRTIANNIADGRNGMTGRVMVQSFSGDNLRRLHAIAPAVPLALTTDARPADPVATLEAARAGTWLPRASTLTADDVAAAHAAGITVVPWTVNDAAGWNRMRLLQVDGVLTDRGGRYVGWSLAMCGSSPRPSLLPS